MPIFTGRHDTTVVTRLAKAAAIDAWLDLDRQVACNPEIASHEKVGPLTVRARLREMSHGPVVFAGHYTMVFTRDGDTVRWSCPDGNVRIQGSARFTTVATGTRIEYEERVDTDLPLNALVAKVVRPIVEVMMAKGQKGFVERMLRQLDGMA